VFSGIGHSQQIRAGFYLADCPAEIFIQWEKGKRLQFAKDPSQFLLDTVNRMKEVTAVHFQAAAAKPPIRAQQKMEPENAVFLFIQRSLAHQTEVCDIVFMFPTPNPSGPFSGAVFERYFAHIPLLRQTFPEARVAGAEYVS